MYVRTYYARQKQCTGAARTQWCTRSLRLGRTGATRWLWRHRYVEDSEECEREGHDEGLGQRVPELELGQSADRGSELKVLGGDNYVTVGTAREGSGLKVLGGDN